jgi:hypothetical protein
MFASVHSDVLIPGIFLTFVTVTDLPVLLVMAEIREAIAAEIRENGSSDTGDHVGCHDGPVQ